MRYVLVNQCVFLIIFIKSHLKFRSNFTFQCQLKFHPTHISFDYHYNTVPTDYIVIVMRSITILHYQLSLHVSGCYLDVSNLILSVISLFLDDLRLRFKISTSNQILKHCFVIRRANCFSLSVYKIIIKSIYLHIKYCIG